MTQQTLVEGATGGTDQENVTEKALEALSVPEFSHLDVDVVIGSHNTHRKKIEQLVKTRPLTKLYVQVENIAELMVQADLAICAGGVTTWERLCLGLPSLVITIAENQIPFTEDLNQDGYLVYLGDSKTVDFNGLRQAINDTLAQESNNILQSRKVFPSILPPFPI